MWFQAPSSTQYAATCAVDGRWMLISTREGSSLLAGAVPKGPSNTSQKVVGGKKNQATFAVCHWRSSCSHGTRLPIINDCSRKSRNLLTWKRPPNVLRRRPSATWLGPPAPKRHSCMGVHGCPYEESCRCSCTKITVDTLSDAAPPEWLQDNSDGIGC